MALRTVASESTAKTAASITEHLHEELLNSSDVEEFLDELARVSARSLSEPGDEVLCRITLLRQRKAATTASSAPLPALSASLNVSTSKARESRLARAGDGPCSRGER
ncbi:hypothetical protein AHiyo4_43260 [Arthrobacter sp. Hiyo4]|nr:hypothetical protein AHiyo4_43260 [Arthrobacter sp. Hiyo4]